MFARGGPLSRSLSIMADHHRIADDLTQLVGGTPLVRIRSLIPPEHARVLAKLEFWNPAASVKDRAALSIIDAAERDGRLAPGGTIIEGTSGNTGIALAWIGAIRGYRVIILMPDDVSRERYQLLRALGAEVIFTPADEGLPGALRRGFKLAKETPGAFVAAQGLNEANVAAHESTTGPEIWEATGGDVDVFLVAVGTGGTITGAGRYLKSRRPDIRVVGVQPAEAPVLTGGEFVPHKIQGIAGGAALPAILDLDLIDEVISIPQDEAIATAREAIAREGLLVGISAGSALAAAKLLAARADHAGKTIVTVLPDTAERYLSTELFDHIRDA